MAEQNKQNRSHQGWNGWQWMALLLTVFMALVVGITGFVVLLESGGPATNPGIVVNAAPPPAIAGDPFLPGAMPDEVNAPWPHAEALLEDEVNRFFVKFGAAVRDPRADFNSFFDFTELTPPDPDAVGLGVPGFDGQVPDPERFAKSLVRNERATWRSWNWDKVSIRRVTKQPNADRYEAIVWHTAKDSSRVKLRWNLIRIEDRLAIVNWENLHTGVTAWTLTLASANPGRTRRTQNQWQFREVPRVHSLLDVGRTDEAWKVIESLQRVRFTKELEYAVELAEARYWLESDEPSDAIAICDDLVKRDPNRLAAYTLLAEACLTADETERVKEVCNTLLSVVGDDPDVLALKAEAHYRLVETDEATAAFETALKLDPYQPIALNWKRRALPAEKKQQTGEWLATAPNPGKLFDPLANAAARDEDWAALAALGQKFRELRPTDSRGSVRLIVAQCQQKKFDSVVAVFRDAIPKLSGAERKKLSDAFYYQMLVVGELTRIYPVLPDELAVVEFRRLGSQFSKPFDYPASDEKNSERFKTNAQSLRQLIDQHRKRFADDIWLAYFEGRLKQVGNDHAGAAEQFAAVLKKVRYSDDGERDYETGYTEVRQSQTKSLHKLGRGFEALRDLKPTTEVFAQLAFDYVTDKNSDGLKKLLAERMKLDPPQEDLAYWQGEMHWLKKEYVEAAAKFRDHLDSSDQHRYRWSASERLVRSLVRAKKLEGAAEALDTVRNLPSLRILVAAAGGNSEEAERLLRETLEEMPHMKDVLYNDEDLGPILRGDSFRQFREDFPPPNSIAIDPKK